MAELNEKQKRFCEEYMVDFCGTQAAIRAGYSARTANEQSTALLAKPHIRAYVDELKAEQSKRTGVNADRVLRELARVAFVNPEKVIKFNSAEVYDELSDDDAATIQSVKVKITPSEDGNIVEREVKLCDKIKALELLGKRFAMFTDKVEAEIKNNEAQAEVRSLLEFLKNGGG